MFEPFLTVSGSLVEGKPLKRFWEFRRPLITRLKPGENEMENSQPENYPWNSF